MSALDGFTVSPGYEGGFIAWVTLRHEACGWHSEVFEETTTEDIVLSDLVDAAEVHLTECPSKESKS